MSDETFEGMPANECPTWADLLGTWRLCRKRACLRGKRCRGEELACLKTNYGCCRRAYNCGSSP